MKKEITRRDFIVETIGAGFAISGVGALTACNEKDARGLPTTVLGKTGVRVPLMALGLGSRFCEIDDPEESDQILNYALDNGLYYWDTAHIYENNKNGVISEERIGRIVKYRRKEIFLSTKVTSRDPNEAMMQIEKSLRRLQTDHLDILKIHNIRDMNDVDKVSEKGNLVDIIQRMKEEGICRFIGFSGHMDAEAMIAMAERFDLDTMLIALNHWGKVRFPREEKSLPMVRSKGLGVMVMKVLRPRDSDPSISPKELIRYGLSLKAAHGAVVGIDSMKVLQENIKLLKSFEPMTSEEMKTMTVCLDPFFHHNNMPWMTPGYCDGNWA
ncbi:Predicted oxidoreductase of the aldo/keto reductase family [Mariniphaga anaerophila]|uniref:Predicted oxidoreductase of the aldo/keto reductase family n=1 Tax=Mariniphaga anaerophila TaxID=1484053 RepID=A0A1M4ZTK8_9BACT|nr:aldo/keto reductase [Mariniphaga anaerophila]SHF21348.1 Predicted oxidoreductase of the aldo/keto reductase family [Mariniphaga anaerophila]